MLRKLVKQRNNTGDSEETRKVRGHLAKVTHRVGGQVKEGPGTSNSPLPQAASRPKFSSPRLYRQLSSLG